MIYNKIYEKKKKRSPFNLQSIVEQYTLDFKNSRVELSLRGTYEHPYFHKVVIDKYTNTKTQLIIYDNNPFQIYASAKEEYDKLFDKEYYNK